MDSSVAQLHNYRVDTVADAVSPILLRTGKLDSVLLAAALERLEPATRSDSPSIAAATATVAAWMLVPLVIGAWRTATRDA